MNGPGETMFDTSLDEKQALAFNEAAPAAGGEFLVPAELPLDQTSQPAPPPVKRDKKHRHAHVSPSVEMDDYFREGEEKSRKEDHAPTPKASGLAPPPKAGPPRTASPL